MPLTAGNVLDRASELLQDKLAVRWTQPELLGWLNDGRRELAIFRPDTYAILYVATLETGTRQVIPNDGTRFLDAIRNMASDGITPGPAVRLVQREMLDAHHPGWHYEAAGPTKHFMFDDRVPRVYFVYPPAAAGYRLEISYSQAPVDLAGVGATLLPAEELYTGALVDYICYRAWLKDASFAGNAQRSALAYAQFRNAVGAGDARDLTASPNESRYDSAGARGGG